MIKYVKKKPLNFVAHAHFHIYLLQIIPLFRSSKSIDAGAIKYYVQEKQIHK